MSPGPDDWGASAGLSDEEVVRRVQRGETALFALIFDRHYGRLERFFRRSGVPEAELEDLLAETFARAFGRIQSYDPEGARYVSYLYAIARNLATDRVRERRRMPELLMIEEDWQEPDPDAVEPFAEAAQRADVARIREAIERLSPSDREIIHLSYDREMNCREIMAVMGKPSITAVTTHLYKAMKRLRKLVGAREELAETNVRG